MGYPISLALSPKILALFKPNISKLYSFKALKFLKHLNLKKETKFLKLSSFQKSPSYSNEVLEAFSFQVVVCCPFVTYFKNFKIKYFVIVVALFFVVMNPNAKTGNISSVWCFWIGFLSTRVVGVSEVKRSVPSV